MILTLENFFKIGYVPTKGVIKMAIPSLYLVSVEDTGGEGTCLYTVAANSHDEAKRMGMFYHEGFYERSGLVPEDNVRLIDKVLHWDVIYEVELSPSATRVSRETEDTQIFIEGGTNRS